MKWGRETGGVKRSHRVTGEGTSEKGTCWLNMELQERAGLVKK